MRSSPLWNSQSTTFSILLAASAAAFAASCERVTFFSTNPAPTAPSQGGGTAPPASRAAALEAVAACSVEMYDGFRSAAAALSAAADAAAADPAELDEARDAWIEAMDVWQRAELFQFGPVAPATFPGGLDLHDRIYSWPLVSRCLVEQTLVSKAYESPDFTATALVNQQGLAAAEYLLFYAGTDNACSAASSINSSGKWAALTHQELAAHKAAYVAVVSAAVAAQAEKLAKAWSPEGENFQAQLAHPTSGTVYTSEQAALNAVSDALFYLEHTVKDAKLARPLGLIDCTETSCPDALESKYAHHSKQHIRNNLLGFRMLVMGCDDGEGVAFDDLLVAAGAKPVADKLVSAIDGALAAADAIAEDDLAVALSTERAHVENLHKAIKAITDVLKTSFTSVLDLDLPSRVEGDND